MSKKSSLLISRRRGIRLRSATVLTALVAGSMLLAACGSSPSNNGPSSKPIAGGTATLAEGAQGQPNYILPFDSAAFLTVANTNDFQGLLWRPLYFFGGGSTAIGLNEPDSLANPPVYSNNDTTVTITLKHYLWSDGQPVTSRDVLFFLNILKANKDDWGEYTTGEIPDNITSYAADGADTVVLHLNHSYNPTWFTDDQLSEIVPMPQQLWDKTSATGAVGNYDTTTAGAKAVYKFLNAQAMDTSTYDTNPLWKVVDGPWQLQNFQNTGLAVFVPNTHYSGPQKPHLSKFEELPYTSDTAQFNSLVAGNGLDVGYVPSQDLPVLSSMSGRGFRTIKSELFQINFIEPNFNNPTVGPVLRQLYVRQALQRVMDQTGQLSSILQGKGGYADYGPIPPLPANPYLTPAQAATNPYPYSPSAARKLLTDHGWTIPASGPASCTRPGTGPTDCGAGIPAGKTLTFQLLYTTGSTYLQEEMENYKSDASLAGISLKLSSQPFNTVVSDTLPCTSSQASCGWQLGTWGAGFAWDFGAPYPTGELLFATGAPDNSANYSSAKADQLLTEARETSTPGVMQAYNTYLAEQLPVIWQICTYTFNEVKKDLRGVSFNPVGPLTPENWYFVH